MDECKPLHRGNFAPAAVHIRHVVFDEADMLLSGGYLKARPETFSPSPAQLERRLVPGTTGSYLIVAPRGRTS